VALGVHGKAKSTFPNITRDKHLDRSRFEAELKAKPWLRDKIMRIAANEEGSNPAGTQAIIESMMNRAEVRGTSLEQQAKWHRREGGYYDEGNMGRGALENARHREILEHSLSEALAGSNVSNYATDNSSGNLAAGERATGKFRYRSGGGAGGIGDTMFSPGSAEPRRAQAYDRWLAQQEGASGGASSAGVDASGKPVGTTSLPAAVGSPDFTSPSASGEIRIAPGRTAEGPHMELSTLDPRLRDIVGTGGASFEAAHPGYKVEAFSGRRHGGNQGPHASETGALDMQIRDPAGNVIPSSGSDPTGMYRELASRARHHQINKYPELSKRFNWGGAHPTGTDGSGPPDLMHFDLSGVRGRFSNSLITNLPPIPPPPKSRTAEVHGSPL
jgi:hypothetical protein